LGTKSDYNNRHKVRDKKPYRYTVYQLPGLAENNSSGLKK